MPSLLELMFLQFTILQILTYNPESWLSLSINLLSGPVLILFSSILSKMFGSMKIVLSNKSYIFGLNELNELVQPEINSGTILGEMLQIFAIHLDICLTSHCVVGDRSCTSSELDFNIPCCQAQNQKFSLEPKNQKKYFHKCPHRCMSNS